MNEKITISTYKNPEDEKKQHEQTVTIPEDKSKQRKQTVTMDIDVNDILALTTAGGDNSKCAKLYVPGYNFPLELPGQSFGNIKSRLIEILKSDYSTTFIPVGPRVLVNYHKIFQIKKPTGEIVFYDDTILDKLDEKALTEFESQVEIIKQKEREQHDKNTKWFWDNLERLKKEAVSKRDNKFTKLFGTTEEKMVIIVFLMLLNIALMLILIILTGILLSKL